MYCAAKERVLLDSIVMLMQFPNFFFSLGRGCVLYNASGWVRHRPLSYIFHLRLSLYNTLFFSFSVLHDEWNGTDRVLTPLDEWEKSSMEEEEKIFSDKRLYIICLNRDGRFDGRIMQPLLSFFFFLLFSWFPPILFYYYYSAADKDTNATSIQTSALSLSQFDIDEHI